MDELIPVLADFIQRKKEHSLNAFGPNLTPTAIIKHIRKEIDEVEKDPNDLEEWMDVALLAIDGAWRVGYSPMLIATMLIYKFEKIKRRNYPDHSTLDPDTPIEHIRSE